MFILNILDFCLHIKQSISGVTHIPYTSFIETPVSVLKKEIEELELGRYQQGQALNTIN
jgi:hypothetical protein